MYEISINDFYYVFLPLQLLSLILFNSAIFAYILQVFKLS